MRRKQLTPSVVRRCAVFLALGGALAVGIGRAEGGFAPVSLSDDQVGVAGSDEIYSARPDGQVPDAAEDLSARSVVPSPSVSTARLDAPVALSPDDLAGPGLTGANWFQGLQQGVDQAFDPSPVGASAAGKTAGDVSPLSSGIKANAIPSLPSFWSGLTCCLAVAGAGMIPRVRRAFLR